MPWAVGETYRNAQLGKTLRTIAAKGVDVFYRGELADNLDRFMRDNDGWTRKSDLKKYKAFVLNL